MAHHLSAKKRIRQDEKKRLRNRYYKKSARTAIAKLRSTSDASDATKQLPRVVSMINVKGKLQKFVSSLASA